MLASNTIKLRALEPGDAEKVWAWENDSSNWKHSSTLHPYSLEEIKKYIHSVNDIYADRQLRLMVHLLNDNCTIGMVDLFDFDPLHGRASVGIYIDEKFRGEGWGVQTLDLLSNYAANVLGLYSLNASVRGCNQISRDLFERSGYKLEASVRNWFKTENDREDLIIYQRIL